MWTFWAPPNSSWMTRSRSCSSEAFVSGPCSSLSSWHCSVCGGRRADGSDPRRRIHHGTHQTHSGRQNEDAPADPAGRPARAQSPAGRISIWTRTKLLMPVRRIRESHAASRPVPLGWEARFPKGEETFPVSQRRLGRRRRLLPLGGQAPADRSGMGARRARRPGRAQLSVGR